MWTEQCLDKHLTQQRVSSSNFVDASRSGCCVEGKNCGVSFLWLPDICYPTYAGPYFLGKSVNIHYTCKDYLNELKIFELFTTGIILNKGWVAQSV
jgi:hypothetical protein